MISIEQYVIYNMEMYTSLIFCSLVTAKCSCFLDVIFLLFTRITLLFLPLTYVIYIPLSTQWDALCPFAKPTNIFRFLLHSITCCISFFLTESSWFVIKCLIQIWFIFRCMKTYATDIFLMCSPTLATQLDLYSGSTM